MGLLGKKSLVLQQFYSSTLKDLLYLNLYSQDVPVISLSLIPSYTLVTLHADGS